MDFVFRLGFALVFCVLAVPAGYGVEESSGGSRETRDLALLESGSGEERFLSGVRQLTFEGKRAGEGYFSSDGGRLVFQSERQADNPFYQIYLMDLETGDVDRVSPGHGKTTCSWIHPFESKVLFASTHADPEARSKQQAELDFRASGQTRRYSWDYDEHYDLYVSDVSGGGLKNLTNTRGYDAEGSWSPDGQWIAFASNRHAYTSLLSAEDAEIFERDKSYMMEIYLMKGDGTGVRRLTRVKGYDGGPFFSPDGGSIVWRRFAPDGATAEVYTMDLDGGNVRQVTRLGAMSWAPYFHPSGDYLIFATNLHGFGNFELYMTDSAGAQEPVRVTHTEGFDGLPVFTPDGEGLSWTTNRTAAKTSQIFMAQWNDEAARKALNLPARGAALRASPGPPDPSATEDAIAAADLRTHIGYLASKELKGRRSGSEGEKLATAYVASVFQALGLEAAGDDGTYYQSYEFTAGVSLGEDNGLVASVAGADSDLVADEDWRPLAFSKTGAFDAAGVVFAGYGIRAPAKGDDEEYDSFVHLDVTDKWVMVFRYMPEDASDELRRHLTSHSSLRFKAMTVRDLGARGLIVVSGPNSQVEDQLVRLSFDASLGGTSVAALSLTDEAAQRLLDPSGKTLQELQDRLDSGDGAMGFEIEGVSLEGHIEIEYEKLQGRNVLGRLVVGKGPAPTMIVIGAHLDHLGDGATNTSLARSDDTDTIHYGADDNASGVGALLEIAQYLAHLKRGGEQGFRRDVIFAAWSGEELGLLGANHFVRSFPGKGATEPLTPEISAYLNMDMIGRLRDGLIIQGVGSSSLWPGEIERRNVPVGLSIIPQNESYLPTDATEFYLRGVPFINAFTGAHEDYHSPRDTADKINYEGTEKIARFMALVARSLIKREEAPDYVEMTKPDNLGTRANLRAYLGTIPDYADADLKGLKLSGVAKGGPADTAGLQAGDIIVELAGKTIENIYDYTFAIEALKIGEPVTAVVSRNGERITLEITPGSRD